MLNENARAIHTFGDLIGALIKTGYKVKPICVIQRPYFSVQGTMLKVGDFKLQVYEYEDEQSKQADLARAVEERRFFKGQNGFQETAIHCWSLGQLNILYTDADRIAKRALVDLLGTPFVGIDRAQLTIKRRQASLNI